MRRGFWAALVLAVALAVGGCGDDEDSGSSSGGEKDPFTEVGKQPSLTRDRQARGAALGALGTFDGTAQESLPIEIHPRAIQWRPRWRCSSGSWR